MHTTIAQYAPPRRKRATARVAPTLCGDHLIGMQRHDCRGDLHGRPCAAIVCPVRHDVCPATQRRILDISWRMGVAGNAPTVRAVIANRANTQVCPYIAHTLHNTHPHAANGRPQGSPLHCVATTSLVCNAHATKRRILCTHRCTGANIMAKWATTLPLRPPRGGDNPPSG